MLCTGTSGGDASLPGFANMVQGELAAPPMTTSSHSGVCAAGLAALAHAAMALEARRASARAGGDQRGAVAPVQALALRQPRLRHRLRRALPALDAVRRAPARGCSRRRRAAPVSPEAARRAPALVQRRLSGVHAGRARRRFAAVVPRLRIVRRRRGRRRLRAPSEHPPAAEPLRSGHPRVRPRSSSPAGSIPARSTTFSATTRRQRFAPVVRRSAGQGGPLDPATSAGTATSRRAATPARRRSS